MALTPAAVAALARVGRIEVAGWWGVFLGGLAAALALYLVTVNRAPLWGYRELQQRLHDRFQREGVGEPLSGGCFVGFAPSATPRLYESFYDWDIGFLSLEGERLCYVGDQTRFALRREQVVELRLAPGAIGWWRAPRVAIHWKDEARGLGGAFTVRPAEGASMRQLGRQARAFAKQLHAWRERPSGSGVPAVAFPSLDVPGFGEVTSMPVARLADMRLFLRTLYMVALLSAGGSVLMGLSFNTSNGDAWAVLITACLTVLFHWVPFFRYREPPADSARPF
jgi:hypothetical protein